MSSPVRIILVDDHQLVRLSLSALLRAQPDFDVICEASDGFAAVKQAEAFQPDVVVLDISMPRLNGLEAAKRIRQVSPSSRILFLSQYDTPETIQEAFRAGGMGYVAKCDAAHELVSALRTVSNKRRYVNSRFGERLQDTG